MFQFSAFLLFFLIAQGTANNNNPKTQCSQTPCFLKNGKQQSEEIKISCITTGNVKMTCKLLHNHKGNLVRKCSPASFEDINKTICSLRRVSEESLFSLRLLWSLISSELNFDSCLNLCGHKTTAR